VGAHACSDGARWWLSVQIYLFDFNNLTVHRKKKMQGASPKILPSAPKYIVPSLRARVTSGGAA